VWDKKYLGKSSILWPEDKNVAEKIKVHLTLEFQKFLAAQGIKRILIIIKEVLLEASK
jgi:hypothetical protein